MFYINTVHSKFLLCCRTILDSFIQPLYEFVPDIFVWPCHTFHYYQYCVFLHGIAVFFVPNRFVWQLPCYLVLRPVASTGQTVISSMHYTVHLNVHLLTFRVIVIHLQPAKHSHYNHYLHTTVILASQIKT